MPTHPRKFTLADIRDISKAPTGSARFDTRFRGRSIRPQRFQPSKDPLDFKLLSETLSGLTEEVTRLSKVSKEESIAAGRQDFFLGKRSEWVSDILSDDPDAHFPSMDLDEKGLEAGDIAGGSSRAPQIIDTEPAMSERMQEQAAQIADLTKQGRIPPGANTLLMSADKKSMGEDAAMRYLDWLETQFSRVTNYNASGRDYTAERAVRDGYFAFIRDNPVLDRSKPEFSEVASKAFEVNARSFAMSFRSRTGKRYAENHATQTVSQVIAPRFHNAMKKALQPTIGNLFFDPATKAYSVHIDSEAEKITASLQSFRDKGLPIDMKKTALDLMRNHILRIERTEEDPVERDEQISMAMDIFERVKFGEIDAENDESFQASIQDGGVAALAARIMDSGSGGSGSRGSRSQYYSIISKAFGPAYEDLRELLEKNPGSPEVAAARTLAMKDLKAVLESKGYDASKTEEVMLAGEEAWNNAMRIRTTAQKSLQAFNADEIMRKAVAGNFDEAENAADLAVIKGSISPDQGLLIRDRINKLKSVAPFIGEGTVFRSALLRMTVFTKQLADQKHPLAVQSKFSKLHEETRNSLYSLAEGVVAQAQKDKKDPNAAMALMMTEGAGARVLQTFLDEQKRQMKTEEDARNELLKATRRRQRINPTRKDELRNAIGEGPSHQLFLNHELSVNPTKLLSSASLVVEATVKEMRSAVDSFFDDTDLTAEIDAKKATSDRNQLMSIILKKFVPLKMAAVNRLLDSGSDQMQVDLTAALTEIKDGLIKDIGKFSENLKTKNKVKKAVSDMTEASLVTGEKNRSSPKNYKDQAGLALSKIHTDTQELLKGSKLFAGTPATVLGNYMWALRYGTKEEYNTAALAWDERRGAATIRIVKNTKLDDATKSQRLYDLYAVDGKVSMEELEAGVSLEPFLSTFQVRYGAAWEVYGRSPAAHRFPTNVRNFMDAKIDLSEIEIDISAPMFQTHGQLDDWVNDPVRFHKMAKRLGFVGLEPGSRPLDSHLVRSWVAAQKDAISMLRVRGLTTYSKEVHDARINNAKAILKREQDFADRQGIPSYSVRKQQAADREAARQAEAKKNIEGIREEQAAEDRQAEGKKDIEAIRQQSQAEDMTKAVEALDEEELQHRIRENMQEPPGAAEQMKKDMAALDAEAEKADEPHPAEKAFQEMLRTAESEEAKEKRVAKQMAKDLANLDAEDAAVDARKRKVAAERRATGDRAIVRMNTAMKLLDADEREANAPKLSPEAQMKRDLKQLADDEQAEEMRVSIEQLDADELQEVIKANMQEPPGAAARMAKDLKALDAEDAADRLRELAVIRNMKLSVTDIGKLVRGTKRTHAIQQMRRDIEKLEKDEAALRRRERFHDAYTQMENDILRLNAEEASANLAERRRDDVKQMLEDLRRLDAEDAKAQKKAKKKKGKKK